MNPQRPRAQGLRLCPFTTEDIVTCPSYDPCGTRGTYPGASVCRYAVLNEVSQHALQLLCFRGSDPPQTVLVVDDDALMCDLMRARFKSEGFAVQTASNGRDALSKLAGYKPDLIVTDWHMPDMDGVQLVGRIRERSRRQPILMLTSDPADTLFQQLQGVANITVLPKWTRWSELRQRVQPEIK